MKRYINLLPPSEQRGIRTEQVNYQILNFGFWVVLSLIVLAVILFAADLIVKSQVSAVSAEVQNRTLELQQLEEEILREDIEVLNTSLENFEKLEGKSQNWSGVLRELARLLPPDLTLDRLSLTRPDAKLEIAGRAAHRASVLKFRENLLSSEYFRNVNFPLANLEKPSDLKWSYRFFVKPEKLK